MDGRRPWPDLPQGIVESIIGKLHFVDQVRALAVCKSWRACKEYVKSSDCLPWVVYHDRQVGNKAAMCHLVDPYSRKVFSKVYKGPSYTTCVMTNASKHGWLIFAHIGIDSYFLHNPFTGDVILLPLDCPKDGITMKVSHKPLKCEIFALSRNDQDCITIETCCFSKDDGCVSNHKLHTFDDKGDEEYRSMLYMKGNIYGFFENWRNSKFVLKSYSLEDESFKLLTKGFPEPYESLVSCYRGWLMEMNENLMLVRLDVDESYKWTIFRFDWSEMYWVVEMGLKSRAIFISDPVAFSQPLTDSDVKNSEECKLFYGNLNYYVYGFKCCSLNEAGGTRIKSHEYERINNRLGRFDVQFVEPPYFGI